MVAQSLYHLGEPLGDRGRGVQQWTWQCHRCLRTQGLGTGAKGCDGSPPGASCLPLQTHNTNPEQQLHCQETNPREEHFAQPGVLSDLYFRGTQLPFTPKLRDKWYFLLGRRSRLSCLRQKLAPPPLASLGRCALNSQQRKRGERPARALGQAMKTWGFAE